MSDKNDLVMIKLDRMREIKFGHKALKTLGAMTGKDIDAITAGDDIDLDNLEIVMYCGLLKDARDNNETLKLEDMEDLLDQAESFADVILKMQEAMKNAFGGMEGMEGAPQAGNPAEAPKPNRAQRRSAGKKATAAK